MSERIDNIIKEINSISLDQLQIIEKILYKFIVNTNLSFRDNTSDIVSDSFLYKFENLLRMHHCFSTESFTKDKFEYAMMAVSNSCGSLAELASKGNAGHDLLIKDQKFSLKTQADRNIHNDFIYISKL